MNRIGCLFILPLLFVPIFFLIFINLVQNNLLIQNNSKLLTSTHELESTEQIGVINEKKVNNSSVILQGVVSMVGGGLAGSLFTALYNRKKEINQIKTREKSALTGLLNEVHQNLRICKFNSIPRDLAISEPYMKFFCEISSEITFWDFYSFPHLKRIIDLVENYSLSISRLNELIEVYKKLFQSINSKPVEKAFDRLNSEIMFTCTGEKKLEGLPNDKEVILPNLLEELKNELIDLLIH